METSVDHNKVFDELSQSHKEAKLPSSGINTFTRENKEDEEVNTLLELQRLKLWLQSQTLELETVLKLRKTYGSSQSTDSNHRIMELEKELLNVSSTNSLKDLVLERMQCSDALINILYPSENESSKNKQVYCDLVEEQTKLVTEILGHHKAIQRTQEELDKVRQEAMDVKKDNRELMNTYQQMKTETEKQRKKNTKHEQEKLIQEELENISSRVIIARHVLQALIMGSGINWAKDPELQELLLSLGETIDFTNKK